MRFLSMCLIFCTLLLGGACITLPQGQIGYLVPGGEQTGNMTPYKKCGAPGVWTYLLDNRMVESTVLLADRTKKPYNARVLVVDLGLMDSCNTLRVYEESK
ncbi:MAG: hypothetical protein K8S54_16015 [Spirochaetia bacterium]|nr:hypothetical protein [Spirochaetia bacterium]